MAYSETQLAHFRAGLRPGECGALVPEASPETMPPFSGALSPTPESSLQVHRVTVTVFIELDVGELCSQNSWSAVDEIKFTKT